MVARAELMADTRICVGVIVGVHGLRGLLRVKSFTAEPTDIAVYGPLVDATDARQYTLKVTGSAKGVLLARIDGIDDRNSAEALKGMELFIARDALPQTEEDEFYHTDLIGLQAVFADGTVYGTVRALHEFGAGDMIEFTLEVGGVSVLPFTRAMIPEIDLVNGRITVEPPTETTAKPEDDA